MEALIIRKMIDEDVEKILAIAVAAWEPIYEHRREVMGDELFTLAHPDWRTHKSRDIRSTCQKKENSHVWVAVEDDKVVGFVSFSCNANKIGQMGNNAVHPDYQGRGIASQLYELALNEMRAHGMQAARVYTGGDPAHAPARRAYEKAGFNIPLPSVDYFQKL